MILTAITEAVFETICLDEPKHVPDLSVTYSLLSGASVRAAAFFIARLFVSTIIQWTKRPPERAVDVAAKSSNMISIQVEFAGKRRLIF
jgi:hypothetical protein